VRTAGNVRSIVRVVLIKVTSKNGE
jgi:hypothetical protein